MGENFEVIFSFLIREEEENMKANGVGQGMGELNSEMKL